jgi:glycosyltransferase involved in cell wall biosynthesis
MSPTDYVIVPTYSEVDNLEDLMTALLDLPLDLGVIVVDDNSPDGTGDLADRWHDKEPDRVQVIHRPAKLGLGTAYLAGFHLATEEFDAARVFTMDADFSHHPRYIPEMVDLGRSKDIVIGSRYVPGGGSRNCSSRRILLSRVANIVARLPLALEAKDATAGFRLYHRRVLDSIPLHEIKSSGYSFQVEMLFLCQRRGWHTGEVPIIFEDRRHGTTKISRHEVYAAVYTVARLFWRRLFGKEPQRQPASR